MIDSNKIKALVDEWLEGKDYFFVDATVNKENKIVVEIDHKDGVWIEDCCDLSRFIESHLNRDEEDFELEVGSAGIGQPLKVLQQYQNNIGNEVEVPAKYTVSVYATKAGLEDSDVSTVELSGNAGGSSSGVVGDVNNDGVTNAADVVTLVSIIMGNR